jgi:endonuclease V-like protein UPF0215 family
MLGSYASMLAACVSRAQRNKDYTVDTEKPIWMAGRMSTDNFNSLVHTSYKTLKPIMLPGISVAYLEK